MNLYDTHFRGTSLPRSSATLLAFTRNLVCHDGSDQELDRGAPWSLQATSWSFGGGWFLGNLWSTSMESLQSSFGRFIQMFHEKIESCCIWGGLSISCCWFQISHHSGLWCLSGNCAEVISCLLKSTSGGSSFCIIAFPKKTAEATRHAELISDFWSSDGTGTASIRANIFTTNITHNATNGYDLKHTGAQ